MYYILIVIIIISQPRRLFFNTYTRGSQTFLFHSILSEPVIFPLCLQTKRNIYQFHLLTDLNPNNTISIYIVTT